MSFLAKLQILVSFTFSRKVSDFNYENLMAHSFLKTLTLHERIRIKTSLQVLGQENYLM